MALRARLYSALHAFLFPSPRPKIRYRDPLPNVVFDNKLLNGKTVLITGAGKNIGRAVAIEMAKQGATILFTDIDSERCSLLTSELKKIPAKTEGFISDVANAEHVASLIATLHAKNYVIDVLVNNVGIRSHNDPFEAFDIEDWRNTFQTNLFGPLLLTKHIVEMMKSNSVSGSLIFISSTHQWSVMKSAAYSSSKAAIGMVVHELALELAPFEIRVNGIAPGAVGMDDNGNLKSNRFAPLHRSAIPPEYIGRAAVFLASEFFSEYTTGTTMTVDAGLSLVNHLAG